MSNSLRALVIVTGPPSSCSSVSLSLKAILAFSVGMPVQTCSSSFGTVFPGHCEQFAAFLQVSVARQYNLSDAAQVMGEFEAEVIPPRAESSFSCISIHTCMLAILVFLLSNKRGHFLGHRFRKVTLSLPTDAALQLDDCDAMLSKKFKESSYRYLLFECLPRPENLNEFSDIFTDGSVTSNAPGAFQRTVYFIVRKMHVSFCAHWNAGATCCAMPYFGLSVRKSSSASSFSDRTALRTTKERSTCCVWDAATTSRERSHHCRNTHFSSA
mmetsp:Transcript_105890/g.226018  ORF Transcript_105890/g.226018 Transcript_105890/m.226018 type:complete len:270 (+) Transcript_105890:1155-1964(+)